MFDPQEVMNKVQQKDYPQDWSVFIVEENLFSTIIQSFFVSLLLGALLGVILATIAMAFSSSPLIGWLVGLVGALPIPALLWRDNLSAVANRYSWFVRLPDGVLECFHGKREDMAVLHFDLIRKMDLDHQTTVKADSDGNTESTLTTWLNVYSQNGTYVKWNIPSRYGDPIALGGTIVAAYEHFMRMHGQTQP